MKFRTMKAVAMAAAAVAAVVGSSSGAQAAAFDGSCNDHEVCNYRLTSYTGGIWDTPGDVSSYVGHYFSSGYTLNDRTSSLKNNADIYDVTHYTDANYSGGWLDTGTNSARASLYTTWDNTFSSHYF
ncbi:peptidase inhibitor family I36 protein [Streptomyces sp. NPDC006602]|uniref:peptidase inhibitor family I36 protein n=1 Tax=Streptomyces sp. NPDC006602 TaxID=3364751 RepID=UPI00368958DC